MRLLRSCPESNDLDRILQDALATSDLPPSRLAKQISRKLKRPRQEIYQRLIELKNN